MGLILSIPFDFDFLPLLIVVAIAWVIPIIMNLLRLRRIPTVVVEIIVGYFVGDYVIGYSTPDSMRVLEFLALSGFLFLMFLSGLEIDVDRIFTSVSLKKTSFSKIIRNPLWVGVAIFISTLLLSYVAAYALSGVVDITNIGYFALIMVTTSVGIVMPVLKNSGEVNTRFGQMIISAAAIADILSIILFTISAFIIENGFKLEIFWILLLIIAFYVFYHIGNWLKDISFFKKINFQLSHAASQISFRGSMLIIMVFVVLSQFIGDEVVLLGAFLGGLLLSIFLHKERSLLIVKLDGAGFGFFIPVFFIMVGVKFDPKALLDLDSGLVVFLSLLLFSLMIVKILPALLWAKLFGTRRAIAGGFLMASRLSLIIAASTIGLQLGVISPAINASFILMAVITCLFSPLLYNIIMPKEERNSEKTIIVGGSSTGVLLARRLRMHNKSIVIIEKSKKRYDDILSKGINAIYGDGSDEEVFKKVNLASSNYVVVVTGDNNEDVKVCKMLQKEFGHEKLIVRSDNSAINTVLKRMEVERIDTLRAITSTIENLILRPTVYNTLIESFDNFSVEEIKIINPNIQGKMLKEIPFHHETTLLLVKREGKLFIPDANTHMFLGDIISVFGTDSGLKIVKNHCSGN